MKLNDEKINTIVDAIKERYKDEAFHKIHAHAIKEHVFLHFAISEYVSDQAPVADDKDLQIKELKTELGKTYELITEWHSQLDAVHDYLCSLTSAKPPLQDGQMLSAAEECIFKIDSLIPNGDKLGELIDQIQSRIPNMHPLNRSQCHHLGKLLYAKLKDNG